MVAIPRLTVRTEYGAVLAVPHRGALLFRNVPYAAPPFGARRFAQPAAPSIWDGLRDGAQPGPGQPQLVMEGPLQRYFAPKTQGEDSLTLEVQTPGLDSTGLPVMVWIHGGGFVSGAGSAQANDGYAFARDNIVHVSINYRLGVDGFMLLDDSIDTQTDNLGLRDQIAALQWVRRNIENFGGDPDNITIAGHSTGASSVAHLLASPAAAGLFTRAISQSGSPTLTITLDEARERTRRFGRLAGVPTTRAGVASIPLEQLIAISGQLFFEELGTAALWDGTQRIPIPFTAVTGTESLPLPVIPAVAAGSAAGVQILAGTTRNETVSFLPDMYAGVSLDSPVGRDILRALHADAATVDHYRSALPEGAPDIVVIDAIATHAWARKPTIDLLAAHDGVDFLYEFTWESPMLEPGTGSVQGIDIPFANDDFENMRDVPRGARMLGKDPSEYLATLMHTAFADFVKVGDPGWQAWDTETRSEMKFGDMCTEVTADAHVM